MGSEVRSIDDGLWVIDHPFSMPGGIQLGTRSTIVRLQSGGLWLHSPGPLTPGIRSWLDENGPVEAIVAPNLLHHFFLAENVEACPDANAYGPPGLAEKISPSFEVRPIDADGHPWKDDLACMAIDGCPKMGETVFLHRPSRTLVLCDLAFNFRSADSFMTRFFLRINGALGSFGPSRLGKSFFFSDHAAVGRSVARLLQWDFDRVILSHGEVLESGGPEALRDAFAWVLE